MSQLIKQALLGAKIFSSDISLNGVIAEIETRAALVDSNRDYYDGKQKAPWLSQKLFDILGLADAWRKDMPVPFVANYMAYVIDTPCQRLKLEGIHTGNATADKWTKDLLAQQRIDGLQVPLYRAVLRDSETFLFCDWDKENSMLRWTHEPAYDGVSGCVAIYADASQKRPQAVIKIWRITTKQGSIGNTMRLNVYTADKILRYISDDSGAKLMPFNDPEKGLNDKETWHPGEIGVIHFRNRLEAHNSSGMSEISAAVSLQDALDRTNTDMMGTSRQQAFPVRLILGFDPDTETNKIEPGAMIILKTPIPSDKQIIIDSFDQAEITPFTDQSNYLIEQISVTTHTPIPRNMGSSAASGEAIKQREIGLLAKVEEMQTVFGNEWENAMLLSAKIQNTYSSGAPTNVDYNAKWKEAAIRDDAEIRQSALEAYKVHRDFELYLEIVAPTYGWDDKKIKEILKRKEEKEREMIQDEFNRAVPSFTSAPPPQQQNGNGNQAPVPQAVGA